MWNTPEREALRKAVVDFTTREIASHLPKWEDDGFIPLELHRKTAAAGILGIAFPESVGGQGGDIIDSAIVTETMITAGASSGLLAGLFTHGIAIPHIAQSGNKELIDRYVRPTLAGEKIGSLGITEPSGGSDVANIKTKAIRDGDHYIVNGAKTYITSGVRADFVTTAVRTGGEGHEGISLLVIDKGTPGFEVSPPLRKLGWHCSDTAELSFNDVRVPVTNLVGQENAGFALIMGQFVNERLSLAVQAYATAERALKLAADYSKQRETFGKPLAARQVIRHKLVDMHRKTAAAKALTQQGYANAIEKGVNDFSVVADALLAKRQAVEAAEWVVSEAVQIFGGMGYMRESEIERHYRDVRIMGIGGGANEVLNDLAARILGY